VTNLVFIERKQVSQKQAQVFKKELQEYAITVALKFPTNIISEKQKIWIARFSVRELLKRLDFSTKNFGALLHDEVISNLQNLYFKLKKTTLNYHFLTKSNKELLEMIKVVKLLKKNQPRKFKYLSKSLQRSLNERQRLIFNIYFRFKPSHRRKRLTYKTVSRLSKIPAGTINHQVKQVVQSLSQILRTQRMNPNGRTKRTRK